MPDLTGYITEGQIVLSAELHARGIYPPVDALSSLSRLMRHGAGPGRTRDDHLDVAAQLLAALAAARRAARAGRADRYGGADRVRPAVPGLEQAFEHQLMSQARDENRTLDETLGRAWQALACCPGGS